MWPWSHVSNETIASLLKDSRAFVTKALKRGRKGGRKQSRDDVLAAYKTFHDENGWYPNQSEVASALAITPKTVQRTIGQSWPEFGGRATEDPHFPGQSYEADGHAVVAYGGIDGARLSEYSMAYNSATPGADVAKASAMEGAGVLDARIAGQLEQAYQVRFPRAAGRTFAGFTAIAGARTIISDPSDDTPDRRDAGSASTRREATRTARVVFPSLRPEQEVTAMEVDVPDEAYWAIA